MKTVLEIYNKDSPSFEDSQFSTSDGDAWTAPYLYAKVKELGLKVEEINLRHISLSCMPWQDGKIENLDCFLYNSVRIQKADLRHPIIMRSDGYIIDGWHRVAKAILEGKETIKAYRFETYLEPDVKGK